MSDIDDDVLYVRALIADWPPLTAEQITVCRRLFRDLPDTTTKTPDTAPALPDAA